MKKLLSLLGLFVFATVSLFAQEEPIGWKTRSVTNVPAFDPTSAPSAPSFATQSVVTNATSGVATMAMSAQTPATTFSLDLPTTLPAYDMARIKELARGLDYDWRKCYGFVRDHIEYAPYFGIMRGPERTLFDREGNDADQSFLLLALLRASGHTATVAYEPLTISNNTLTGGFYLPLYNYDGNAPYNAASWLDIPVSGTVSSLYERVSAQLVTAGRSVTYLTVSSVPCIATDHFWIVLTVDGVTYYLDPSFKPTIRATGHDIASDMGYLRSALIFIRRRNGGCELRQESIRNGTFLQTQRAFRLAPSFMDECERLRVALHRKFFRCRADRRFVLPWLQRHGFSV